MNQPVFSIRRTLDAPRELVWEVYTQAEHLKHWWGPAGMTVAVADVDLRPGGLFHYCMRSPDGYEMWGKWLYVELVAPEKMTIIVSFSDAEKGVTRHPMSPTWPAYMRSEMTLIETDGKTELTLTATPHEATPEEIETFAAAFDSMTQGFSGTFAQLEAYMAGLDR